MKSSLKIPQNIAGSFPISLSFHKGRKNQCCRRQGMIKAQDSVIVKEVMKIKSKTKNKPKDQKKINQTKNKGKKEWKQR